MADQERWILPEGIEEILPGEAPRLAPARVDAHYRKRECPVRLCYVGSVLRTRPDVFAGSRELLQLGAELFGHPGPESDIEIARLMLAALASAGLSDLHLALGHVGVFRALAAEARLSEELESDLFDALQRKARSRIEALLATCEAPARANATLAVVAALNGGGEPTISAARLAAHVLLRASAPTCAGCCAWLRLTLLV